MAITTNHVSKWKITFYSLMIITPFYSNGEIIINHLVPAGFTAVEEDTSRRILVVLNGEYLPFPLFYSHSLKRLDFDKESLLHNGIVIEKIVLLEKLLEKLPYDECKSGCDYFLNGHSVTLDKINQTLIIKDPKLSNVLPITTFGLVHNQSVDLRAANNNYLAISANGQGYIGLPFQSYGYLGWFYNNTSHVQRLLRNGDTKKGIGQNWYIQKNFSSVYLRAGHRNYLDNSAARVQTLISPALDHFVSLGSQHHISSETSSAETLVLYATQNGDFDIYRDGQFIRRFPAQLGRNEIDYAQLPSGYYNADIRLIDRTGREVSRESLQIANISFHGNKGWFITVGESLRARKKKKITDAYLIQFGRSMITPWFNSNVSLLADNAHHWAAEGNISRPLTFGRLNISPSLGVISGEKGSGGYLRLSGSNPTFGFWSVSRYQNPNVSFYTPTGNNSSTFSYGRRFGTTTLSYHLHHANNAAQHRLHGNWRWQQPQYGVNFSIGVRKDQRNDRKNDYGLFLNATLTFKKHNTQLTSIYTDKHIASGINYQHNQTDDYGNTALGLSGTVNRQNYNLSSLVSRQGSRGNLSAEIGASNQTIYGGLHYDGMVAANTQGIAFGPNGYTGTAMLVKTPDVGTPYSFSVEGYPVVGGTTTAIPVPRYAKQTFAEVQTRRNDMDMHINLPVNFMHAHPGQVFAAQADIQLTLLYNGFFIDAQNQPVSGTILETGETVYPNGLFSIISDKAMKHVNVQDKTMLYLCDLRQQHNHDYLCHPK